MCDLEVKKKKNLSGVFLTAKMAKSLQVREGVFISVGNTTSPLAVFLYYLSFE